MKRILIVLGICASLISFFIVFQITLKKLNNCNESSIECNNNIKQKSLEIEISNNSIKRIAEYSGIKLSSLLEYVDIGEAKQLLADYAIKKGPILVFRNSEIMCDACINEQLRNLNEFSLLKAPEKLCVITSFSRPRNLNYFMRYNKIEIDALNVKSLLEFDNEISEPYYFVLQRDLTISHLYFPNIDRSDLTKEYLKFVVDKYFSIKDVMI
jgi:hypothetical protein